jgi:hypothetical protein
MPKYSLAAMKMPEKWVVDFFVCVVEDERLICEHDDVNGGINVE